MLSPHMAIGSERAARGCVGELHRRPSARGCVLWSGAREDDRGPLLGVSVRGAMDADLRSFALVVGIGRCANAVRERADVWLPVEGNDHSVERAIEALWDERIVPFERNLRSGVRAPRRQRALIVDADPSWPEQARRLMGRLDFALGHLAERIDHIGSTSVPGLPAKDLVDIQVVVADLTVAVVAARAAASAGFVHVSGEWFGPGTERRSHREEVCVDADPGRPVNVNIRPLEGPVWRDTLLFRDWLRESCDGREEYAALKRSLAERADLDIDGYGVAKAQWVSTALRRAAEWATSTRTDASSDPSRR